MNSLMQCYNCSHQVASMYPATGSQNFDVCRCDADVNHAAAAANVFSTSSLFSRRHHQLAQHRSRLPAPEASQANCCCPSSYSYLGVAPSTMPECRHSTPAVSAGRALVDAPSTSFMPTNKLSPVLPYDAKVGHHPSRHAAEMTSPSNGYSEVCRQPLYTDSSRSSFVVPTYKVERPSPPATPSTEPHQVDATEPWNSALHYNELDISTDKAQNDGQVSEKNDDKILEPSKSWQDNAVTADSNALTRTSTTMTTAPTHQQQASHNTSCDIKQTQFGVVYPIYPWMTRVHSTHGKFLTSLLNDRDMNIC